MHSKCILGPFLIVLIALAAAISCRGPESHTTSQTTEPASGFVFTAAGDYGSSRDTSATLDRIARSGANFNLALGDLSYTDASESDWCDYVRSRVGDRFSFQLVAGNHEDDFGGDGHISEFASCLPDRMDSVNLLIPNEKGSAAGVGGCPLACGAHTALRTVIPFPLLADASRASLFFSWH